MVEHSRRAVKTANSGASRSLRVWWRFGSKTSTCSVAGPHACDRKYMRVRGNHMRCLYVCTRNLQQRHVSMWLAHGVMRHLLRLVYDMSC